MTYTDILQVDDRFQSSINLQYDIGNPHKIECYIPTDQSVQVLREYLSAIYYGNKREYATVLIGPYGKGKSHLMLVLLSLLASTALCREADQRAAHLEALNHLIARIERVDADTAALAREILAHRKPLLPVIVDSNATEINQVLILALRDALERCGCEDLLPEMNFDVAVKMIDRWRESYPDAFEKLRRELLPHKYTVEEMLDALRLYSRSAYDTFVAVYPAVTSGSAFAPIFSEGAIELYKSVNKALISQTEFGGMFIVYDEFSKFLEANLDKSRMLNFKVVQELAELAARSSDAELHFACITHKDLLHYNNSDSFRTVIGRFKQIAYVHSSDQAYELIANAIEKKPAYRAFLAQNADAMERAMRQVYASGLFRALDANTLEETILKGCYPLAPMTTYGLLHISEKVAQNERTLFTFLAGRERHTAMSFIQREHDGMEFMTLDVLFDYFASAFAMEVFNRGIHSIWAKASAALRIAETELQQKLIKALAAILIIGDEQARPNEVNLKAALLISDAQFREAADGLCRLKVLTKRDTSDEYAFLTSNGVDIQNSLQNYISSKLPSIQVCEELERFIDPSYALPRQYNNDYKIIRFFRRVFMDAALFCAYADGRDILADVGADGAIIQIVLFSPEDREKVLTHCRRMEHADCVLLAVNEQDFPLESNLKELVAIQALKQSEIARADAHYAEELEIYEEDLLRYLQKQIAWAYSTANADCRYYHRGEWIVTLTKGLHLARYVSEICAEIYPRTPVINNEMINKSVITGPIRKARSEVVAELLHAEAGAQLEWSGYGPEVSIYRSTIANKGLDGLHCASDPNLERMLFEIDAFARSAIGQREGMSALYSRLTAAPFGVRRGVLPIYIAYVLNRFEGTVSFYWGDREFPFSAETLESVDADPEKYALYIDEATEEKERYVNGLCALFSVDEAASNRNSLLVLAMQRWIRSLPKVARDARREYRYLAGGVDSESVPAEIVRLRKSLLTFDVNVRELLMEDIPQRVFDGCGYDGALQRIAEARAYLDGYLPRLKAALVAYARELFSPGYGGSLAQAIRIWRENRAEQSLKKLYDTPTNLMLKYIANPETSDDETILSHIGLLLANIAVEDWSDAGVADFCEKLKRTLDDICAADSEARPEGESAFSITIAREDQSIERLVGGREISPLGKTLMNNLRYSFNEYGGAISADEKVAILVEMLKEIIGET